MKRKTANERDLTFKCLPIWHHLETRTEMFRPFSLSFQPQIGVCMCVYMCVCDNEEVQLIFRDVRSGALTILLSSIMILCICRNQLLLLPVP